MRVAVIGGGVVGCMTSYYLHQKGYQVTLFEKEADVAEHASLANASTLHFSYIMSLGSPYLLKNMHKVLLRQSEAMQIKNYFDMSFWAWALRLLPYCRKSAYETAQNTLIELAQKSKTLFAGIRECENIDFDFKDNGKLALYDNQCTFEWVQKYVDRLKKFDVPADVLTQEQAFEKEPALNGSKKSFVGGVYYPDDAFGDCQKLCRGLTAKMKKSKTFTLKTNTPVKDIVTEGEEAKAVLTKEGLEEFDQIAVCTGAYMDDVLKSVGINECLYPIKGYVMTFDRDKSFTYPAHNITDDGTATVMLPLGKRFKVSSFVHFNGYDTTFKDDIIRKITRNLHNIFPDMPVKNVNLANDFRPYAPSGVPIVKQTKYKNVFVNLGHGRYGWTLSAVTGHNVANLMSDKAA